MSKFNKIKDKLLKNTRTRKEKKIEEERIEREKKIEEERIEREKKAEEERIEREKEKAEKKKKLVILGSILIAFFLFLGVMSLFEDSENKSTSINNENNEVKKEKEALALIEKKEAEEKKVSALIEKKEKEEKEALALIEKKEKENETKKPIEKENIIIDKMVMNIIETFHHENERIAATEREGSTDVEVFDKNDINLLTISTSPSSGTEEKNVTVILNHNHKYLKKAAHSLSDGYSVKIFRALNKEKNKVGLVSITHLVLEEDIYGNEKTSQSLKVILNKETFDKVNWEKFESNNLETIADTYILNEELR